MFKRLQESCETGKISYYWQPSCNLLAGVPETRCKQMAKEMSTAISEINNLFPTQPTVLAKNVCKLIFIFIINVCKQYLIVQMNFQ